MSLLDELITIERDGWRSLCDSTGAAFYGPLMTDDGEMLLANGHALDRDAVVESLGSAPPWTRFELEEPRVIPLGDDAAALVYVGLAWRSDGDEPDFTGLMTSVYRRVDGQWRLALYQQTPRG